MITEKLYGEPESFDVDPQEIADYLEEDEGLNQEISQTKSSTQLAATIYHEVKDEMVDDYFEEKDFESIMKDLGATTGLFGGGSVGSNGTETWETGKKLYFERSAELPQIADALLPELSDPSFAGIGVGAVLGVGLGLKYGGEAGKQLTEHLNEKQRRAYEKQLLDDLDNIIEEYGVEDYINELGIKTRNRI